MLCSAVNIGHVAHHTFVTDEVGWEEDAHHLEVDINSELPDGEVLKETEVVADESHQPLSKEPHNSVNKPVSRSCHLIIKI